MKPSRSFFEGFCLLERIIQNPITSGINWFARLLPFAKAAVELNSLIQPAKKRQCFRHVSSRIKVDIYDRKYVAGFAVMTGSDVG